MKVLTNDECALLQARHLYNDTRIEKVIHGDGLTVGSDELIIKVNRYAWGLFETTILNALKENEFLRERNPELFSKDVRHSECKGVGSFPFTDEENRVKLLEWNENMKEDDYFYCKPGTKFVSICRGCQGTGIVLKEQPSE